MSVADDLATGFREAMRPLVKRLSRERTLLLGKAGILGHLDTAGPATAAELAVAERISPQAVAMAVRELEELAYVVRRRDEVDRRKLNVEITDAGRVALRQEREAGTVWLAETIASRLDDAERAALAAVVPVLHRILADPSQGGPSPAEPPRPTEPNPTDPSTEPVADA